MADPGGHLMPETKSRLSAWSASALVALASSPRLARVTGPGAEGRKFERTTPPTPQMKKPNTGFGPEAAQAERSGRLSRNGSATVAPATPRKNARRLGRTRFLPLAPLAPVRDIRVLPPHAGGTQDCARAR